MIICDKDSCLSCHCCENICPMKCISMKSDEYGMLYAHVDESKCIKCNKCINTCPQNNESDFNTPKKVYACYSLDKEDRASSASGGMASVFYQRIISQSGVAFGTKFQNNLEVNIVPAETIEETASFKTSKYVQASVGKSYSLVKSYLKDDRKVLYIGTPCQIDGLLNFLGKLSSNDNLVTVDLICHGTPPIKYLQEYAFGINKEADRVSFRGKDNFIFNLYKEEQLLYSKSSKKDLYFAGFMATLNYKKACYQCKYAQEKRVSDITIGDFWGLGVKVPFEQDAYKVSLALINTAKGISFFDSCRDLIFAQERDYSEAKEFNPQLNAPSTKHKDTDLFFEEYKSKGFVAAIKATSIPKEIKIDAVKAQFNKIGYYSKRVVQKITGKG